MNKWLNVAEAAAYLKLARKTIYNLHCAGKLRGYNSGGTRKGKLLFLIADLDLYITGG